MAAPPLDRDGPPRHRWARRRRPPPVGRHVHERVRSRRGRHAGLLALLTVIGPGVLAGLSDDDPPGITTYSVLGADYGYTLLWVLTISTAALVIFHEVAVRTGVVTGRGLLALIRERLGTKVAGAVVAALLVANFGTLAAEFAGLAAAAQLLTGVGRGFAIPVAAVAVTALVLRGRFHRVEHVLLALSTIFVTYIVAGALADPDWGAAARGLVVPHVPAGSEAIVAIVAAIGTTLAPWGLAFIQSYAVDKRLKPSDLKYERVDVVGGAVMTGVIGFFVVIACAATLHVQGVSIDEASDAARGLEPLAGDLAQTLFGLGFLGAALLAIAVVPLATAYSVAEAAGKPAALDAGPHSDRLFHATFVCVLALAAAVVLVPSVPLVPLLYLSQALNAGLLLAILPFIRGLARDPELMGQHRLGGVGSVVTAIVILLVAASVAVLAASAVS
jgi:Mn2+/Fe2+ NRAMP family transporter